MDRTALIAYLIYKYNEHIALTEDMDDMWQMTVEMQHIAQEEEKYLSELICIASEEAQ